MKIKKGDKIRIITGKDAGKEGTVEKTDNKNKTVLVLGLNMYKKHIKKSEKIPQGGVVEIPRPLVVSKVALVCPHCGKLARVKYIYEEKKKWRVCKRCDQKIAHKK
ncbi:MAG TPA: 50S ribosomal protein L24 [Patescibacteria group bacterium]|nr:50S ribosomal protein L24 [Patescibacteria group bacterium]